MSDDRLKAILGCLDSAELQHENSEGEKAYRVLLPEVLLETLVSHLQRLRAMADLEGSIASKVARAGLPPEGHEGKGEVNAAIQGTPAAMREAVARAGAPPAPVGKYPKMTHEEIRARAEASRMDNSSVSRRLAHVCFQLLDEIEAMDGRKAALDFVVRWVARYKTPGFTAGSSVHEIIEEHIPWLVEKGFLIPGEDGKLWTFNRERVKQDGGEAGEGT